MGSNTQSLSITYLFLCLGLLGSGTAQAFDVLKLHCFREEHQGTQIFLSQIHFRVAGSASSMIPRSKRTPPPTIISNNDALTPFEGELVSYAVHGSTQTYVSGYNFYSVSYGDDMVSGLTGDPITRSDGSFSLIKIGQGNSGPWKFSYTDTDGHSIDATFDCKYNSLIPNNY